MVRMVPDVIVHKSNKSIDEGGDGKDKKVSIIGVLQTILGQQKIRME